MEWRSQYSLAQKEMLLLIIVACIRQIIVIH